MHPELGVAAGGEGVSARQELFLELGILEDLSVLGDPDRAVLVAQGLTAPRQVHDRQSPRPQGQSRLDVDMLVVRSAMGDRTGHRQQPRRGKLALTSQIDRAGNATHARTLQASWLSPMHARAGSSHPAPPCRGTFNYNMRRQIASTSGSWVDFAADGGDGESGRGNARSFTSRAGSSSPAVVPRAAVASTSMRRNGGWSGWIFRRRGAETL